MSEVGGTVRGYACTAAFIAPGSSPAFPAVIVEVAAGDLTDAHELISQLADAGLAGLASESDMQGRAVGWMILARRGLDRVDVLVRASDVRAFFGGTCVIRDDWLESVARTGHCILIAGSIGLNGVPDAAPDPELVTRMVDAARASGLVAGGLVPVYLPSYESRRNAKVWPGTVAYRRQGPGGAHRGPLGLSITLDETEEFAEVADPVRAEARGMSYEWVRQRLAVELLLRGHMMLPRIVDQVAEDITFTGPAARMRRAVHAGRAALATSWLAVRSIAAFALHRPLPHWHVLGTHVIGTCGWEAWLEVAIDPWADELLAVGEPDEIDVWLGMYGETAHTGGPDDIAVYRGDYRLGVLSDAGVYSAILMEPRHADIYLLTDALRSRAADGSWRLRVRSPR
jgi:hypothetical protein